MGGRTKSTALPHVEPAENAIAGRIHVIRGARVMLDVDLAALYGVSTKQLNQAVRRNRGRFPEDFMFQLAVNEFEQLISQSAISNRENLRSQSVTSNVRPRGGRRYPAYAFTEQGVAMLSSVLTSERAIAVNILIMRTFVQLRRAEGQLAELSDRIEDLATSVRGHDELFSEVFAALQALAEPPPVP